MPFARTSKNLGFVTTTVVEWVDIFTRHQYRQIIIDSLAYCQKQKGLELYAWVLMSNHLHFVASAADGYELESILRDFKKFTSKAVLSLLKTDTRESRRKWMLEIFAREAANDSKLSGSRFWQRGCHVETISSSSFLWQKIDYIHNNPVKAGYVTREEHFPFSSAIDYAGGKGLLDVTVVDKGVSLL